MQARTRAFLGSCLAIALVACRAMPAKGQPVGKSYDSIEWMVADSSVIARGSIVGRSEQGEDPDGVTWQVVTFRIDEAIKGTHHPEVRFIVEAGDRQRVELRRWQDGSRPLLVFLQESRFVAASNHQPKWARFPLAPRGRWNVGSFLDLTPQAEQGAYDLSLASLGNPEAILKATRAAVATTPSLGQTHALGIRMGPVDLKVPVDGRLEERARAWARSPDQAYRALAAEILGYFHSEANVALLRRLAEDSSTMEYVINHDEQGVARKKRVYEVRDRASSTLQALGYEVPDPIPRE